MSTFTTKTNATITIYRDDSDPNNTGWAYRVVGEGQNESGPIDDLHDLLAVLGEHEPVDRREDAHGVKLGAQLPPQPLGREAEPARTTRSCRVGSRLLRVQVGTPATAPL